MAKPDKVDVFVIEDLVTAIVTEGDLNSLRSFAGQRQFALLLTNLYSWMNLLGLRRRRWFPSMIQMRFQSPIEVGEYVSSHTRLVLTQGRLKSLKVVTKFLVERGDKQVVASHFTLTFRDAASRRKFKPLEWQGLGYYYTSAVNLRSGDDWMRILLPVLNEARQHADHPKGIVPWVLIRIGTGHNDKSPVHLRRGPTVTRSADSSMVPLAVVEGRQRATIRINVSVKNPAARLAELKARRQVEVKV